MPNKNNERSKRVIAALKNKVSYLRFFVYVFVVTSFLLTSLILFWINSSQEDVFEAYYSDSTSPEASLYMSPRQGTFHAGDEFAVDVLVNTGGHSVVATAAYISFNTEAFEVVSVDTASSVFDMEAEKQVNNKEGKIKLTLGKPTPGIKSNAGLVAKIRFKALKQTDPRFENIYFDFARNSSLFSTVILDDKKGTNILTATKGIRAVVD